MSVTVPTLALRQALLAVKPHLPAAGGDEGPLRRVHCTVRGDRVEVVATNGVSAGLALVPVLEEEAPPPAPIPLRPGPTDPGVEDVDLDDFEDLAGEDIDEEDPPGGFGSFDLSPAEVAEVLLAFKVRSADDDSQMQCLRIEQIDAEREELQLLDVSGLFPGKRLGLPRDYAYDAAFPDIGGALARLVQGTSSRPQGVVAAGGLVAAFRAASAAYDEPLQLQFAGDGGRTLVVACGESFLGLLATIREPDDETMERKRWRAAWLARLGEMS